MRSEDVQVKRIDVALQSVTNLLDPEIQTTDTTQETPLKINSEVPQDLVKSHMCW